MAVISVKDLLEAGVHFGHQTRKWHPKMAPFIFEERNGIYIVDLQKTQRFLDYATQYVRNVAQKGGTVMFVGTKRQVRDIVRDEAVACNMPYVTERWLGGMLTNMQTIRKSISRLEEIEELERSGTMERLPKKEQSSLRREIEKLHRNLDGVRHMAKMPDVVFIIDISREHLALAEARRLGVTIVAVVDTNCNPDLVDFPIPGNDDAISAVRLMASTVSKSVSEGVQYYQEVAKNSSERTRDERDRQRTVKPTSHHRRTDATRKLQEQLAAKADASAVPDEEIKPEEEAAAPEQQA